MLFEKSEHVWMIYELLGMCNDMYPLDELFYSSLPCLSYGCLVCGTSVTSRHDITNL